MVRHWAQVQPPLIRFSVNCGQKLTDQTRYTTAVKCTLNVSSLLLSLMRTNPYNIYSWNFPEGPFSWLVKSFVLNFINHVVTIVTGVNET